MVSYIWMSEMRLVYYNIGLICVTSAGIIFLLILGVNIQAQQQQPVTETIKQNSAVSAVTVADENATSASLISTKPSQIVQAVSMIELQFHMHVVSKSIQPFPETVYRIVMSKWVSDTIYSTLARVLAVLLYRQLAV